jgi:hypothetical protein
MCAADLRKEVEGNQAIVNQNLETIPHMEVLALNSLDA